MEPNYWAEEHAHYYDNEEAHDEETLNYHAVADVLDGDEEEVEYMLQVNEMNGGTEDDPYHRKLLDEKQDIQNRIHFHHNAAEPKRQVFFDGSNFGESIEILKSSLPDFLADNEELKFEDFCQRQQNGALHFKPIKLFEKYNEYEYGLEKFVLTPSNGLGQESRSNVRRAIKKVVVDWFTANRPSGLPQAGSVIGTPAPARTAARAQISTTMGRAGMGRTGMGRTGISTMTHTPTPGISTMTRASTPRTPNNPDARISTMVARAPTSTTATTAGSKRSSPNLQATNPPKRAAATKEVPIAQAIHLGSHEQRPNQVRPMQLRPVPMPYAQQPMPYGQQPMPAAGAAGLYPPYYQHPPMPIPAAGMAYPRGYMNSPPIPPPPAAVAAYPPNSPIPAAAAAAAAYPQSYSMNYSPQMLHGYGYNPGYGHPSPPGSGNLKPPPRPC